MIAFWTPPYSLLGEDDTYMDIIYSISVVIVSAGLDEHRTVESISAEITDPELQKYFTITTSIRNAAAPCWPRPSCAKAPVNSRAWATIIGKVPVDAFEHCTSAAEADTETCAKAGTKPNSTFVKIDVTASDGSTVSKVYEIRHRQNYDN